MKSILCVGAVYVDINCLSFPCEDGLPTEKEVIGGAYEVAPGGSAVNFARFGRAVGLDTVVAGKIGRDRFGELLREMLHDLGVRTSLRVDESALTELGINYVAPRGSSVMTVVGSANRTLSPVDVSAFLTEHADDISYLYLGGCFKFPDLLGRLREVAVSLRRRGVPTILDHGRVPRDVTAGALREMRALARVCGVYLPSREELLSLWEETDLDRAVRRVLDGDADDGRDGGAPVVAVKDGADGAVGYTGGERISVEAHKVEVRNTVGAGDSFNAGFVAALAQGADLAAGLELGCATAARTISGSGSGTTPGSGPLAG